MRPAIQPRCIPKVPIAPGAPPRTHIPEGLGAGPCLSPADLGAWPTKELLGANMVPAGELRRGRRGANRVGADVVCGDQERNN